MITREDEGSYYIWERFKGPALPLQARVYKALAELAIPFERVETDEVITMEDCALVNERLDMETVKTLFIGRPNG